METVINLWSDWKAQVYQSQKSWVTEKQINNETELDKWVLVDVLHVLHLDTRIVIIF